MVGGHEQPAVAMSESVFDYPEEAELELDGEWPYVCRTVTDSCY